MSCAACIVYTFQLSLHHANFGQFLCKTPSLKSTVFITKQNQLFCGFSLINTKYVHYMTDKGMCKKTFINCIYLTITLFLKIFAIVVVKKSQIPRSSPPPPHLSMTNQLFFSFFQILPKLNMYRVYRGNTKVV